MKIPKEDILRFLSLHGRGEWVVSSSPFDCKEGHSKVYLRKKIGHSGGLKLTGCIPNDEAKELKRKVRQIIKK